MDNQIAAIVLAAGLGTRMRSGRAKVLHELGGEPMLARTLRSVALIDPNPLAVVVGHQAEQVASVARAALPDRDVRFALQREQRGTGDAARRALDSIPPGFNGDVLIAYGDMPMLRPATLRGFIDDHRRRRAKLSFISAKIADPASYGRVVRDVSGRVRAIVEARDATANELAIAEINTGIYLAEGNFLRAALAELRPDNAQHEFYLTDIIAIARRLGIDAHAWIAADANEFAGINSREELALMEAQIRHEINRRLMASGVTMIDPATAYIGPEVEIGPDTTIGPNVQIIGKSRIGAGVVIEGTAWLRDVSVGDRSHLKLGVRAEQCVIGEDCEIGPFANLREGTYLAGHNRIGNFVETKKARVGRGTKASHLSYLGDTIIGDETNVGCGVITVNYDGYDKHVTEIGSRCMVGCDTQLIAPVKVGDDVYVASGTTILRDVADGALVMSEHPQREKPGWTESWHKRHENHPKTRAANGSMKKTEPPA
ncbi:MAG TPA: bifunctional UDP-N-acetylglucosamine diphosphorylase/glucosamine-1-phosphate N-acetyltransferase GlmU [Candidatus Binataceae bacterium]|nr:bifunctional UDP-N-acetylglucosamine diphosphorylase/glucosamine-1-phosphate N-acetyltransferase GlmU [Candidatus Binataceae bacterium]